MSADMERSVREHVKHLMRRGDLVREGTSPRALAYYEAAGHAARTILGVKAEDLRVEMVIEDAEQQFAGGDS